jgi:hypothetical protein
MSTHVHGAHGLERRPVVHVPGSLSIQLAAIGGVIFFALVVAFATMTNGSPAATDSARKTFDYVSVHDTRLQFAAVLLALAMSAVLLFLSGLFRAVREAEGGKAGLAVAVLGGGVLAASSTVTGALILGTTATRIAEIGPGGIRLWWTMFLMSFGATSLGLMLLVGATAIVGLETQLFPRWFALASIVLSAVSLVGAFTIGYATTGTQVTAGIAVILDSVWIFLVSLYLWADPKLGLSRRSSR